MFNTPFVYTGHGLPGHVVVDVRQCISVEGITPEDLFHDIDLSKDHDYEPLARLQEYAQEYEQQRGLLRRYIQDYDRIELAERIRYYYTEWLHVAQEAPLAINRRYAEGVLQGIHLTLALMQWEIQIPVKGNTVKERG